MLGRRSVMRLAVMVGIAAWLHTSANAAWSGLMGLTFDSNRPIESKALYCPSGFITGLRVKYGRTRHEDRDLYDFKLKCGNRWTSWGGMWFKNEVEDKVQPDAGAHATLDTAHATAHRSPRPPPPRDRAPRLHHPPSFTPRAGGGVPFQDVRDRNPGEAWP